MNILESQVLRIIAENTDAPDVFTDTPAGLVLIRGSLNDAIAELSLVTGSYTRTYYLPLFVNRQWYRLAPVADYVVFFQTVWDREHHYRLTRNDFCTLKLQDPFFLRRQGRPLQYVTAGFDYIGFYPIPSEDGKVLELTSACIPHPYMSDTDPIKLREQFQRAAVQYAAAEFFASRGDAKRADYFFQRYTEIAGLFASTPEYADRSATMLSPDGRMGEWNQRSGQ